MENLFQKTLDQIQSSNLPLTEIAKGANVGHRWLVDLVRGRFSDPGVNKIERLHNFLKSRK